MAALINYVAQDRPDIQYASKECMRFISSPPACDEIKLKRIIRYLKTAPRLVSRYQWAPLSSELLVYVDANWAGCVKTRRSTVGGSIQWQGQFLKSWSRTMEIIALSSGESELAAVIRGTAEALGVQSLLKDFGRSVTIQLKSDATAAIGMVKRLGLGRVRHLSVADLWIQQRLRQGGLALSKWPGTLNPSDMMTKHLGRADIKRFAEDLSFTVLAGRPTISPVRAGKWKSSDVINVPESPA